MSTLDSVKPSGNSLKTAHTGKFSEQDRIGDSLTSTSPFSGFKKILGDRHGPQPRENSHDSTDNPRDTSQEDITGTHGSSVPANESTQKRVPAVSNSRAGATGAEAAETEKSATANQFNSANGAVPVTDSDTLLPDDTQTNTAIITGTTVVQEGQGTKSADDPQLSRHPLSAVDDIRKTQANPNKHVFTSAAPGINAATGNADSAVSQLPTAEHTALVGANNTTVESEAGNHAAVIPVHTGGRLPQAGNGNGDAHGADEGEQPDENKLRVAQNADKSESNTAEKSGRLALEAGVAALRADASRSNLSMQNTSVTNELITPGTLTSGESASTSRSALTADPSAARPQSGGYPLMAANNTIKVMLNRGINSATVNLQPAELGSMRINVEMRADQLQVQIVAIQPATRDTLEAALPRLREQLESEGFTGVSIELGSGTTQDSPSERTVYQQAANEPIYRGDNPSGLATDTDTSNVRGEGTSLVDLFA